MPDFQNKTSVWWLFKFAWNDSKGSRAKLALFVSSMMLGVAALVSINSFGDNLKQAIDLESKSLLGADLSFESNKPFPDAIEAIIDTLQGDKSRRTSFSSMAYFPKTGSARLATVRGHEKGFPYYGSIETDPPEAAASYLDSNGALVDGALMAQYGAQLGDSIKIGVKTYTIAGRLVQTPRETAAIMLFSPRIYVPLAEVDTTLLAEGSRADYEVYVRFSDNTDADELVEALSDTLRAYQVRTDTVQEERDGWTRSLSNLYRFLGLVGFMSLLLGSLGVASSIHVYVKQRIQTVAIIRCYGASANQAFSIYLIQAAAMGAFGAFLGSMIGIGVQTVIPTVLGDFLPVDVQFHISWGAVVMGSLVGFLAAILFALLPLLNVRSIPPLAALRSEYESNRIPQSTLAIRLVYGVVALVITALALIQAPNYSIGFGYAGAIVTVFGLLTLLSKVFIRVLAKYPVKKASFAVRQGVANLYRPANQTLLMVLAIGFGAFLVSTMVVSERTLLGQINLASSEGTPNLVFYDIQSAQVDSVVALVKAADLPVIDQVPMITMRLSSVKNRTVESLRADSTVDFSWAHRREYRSTYRNHLNPSEKLVSGTFEGEYAGTGLIPVSIEQDVANQLGVQLGDSLGFSIQGIEVETRISSIREVDWRQMQTNFFFVFPSGAIDNAPAFHVVMSRTATEEESANVQAGIVRSFPNVSSIDISVVLNVFNAIFSRIAFVVRFMAAFSIITGMLVLAGAVMISRFQRIEESVLLKTLGASRKLVLRIMTIEYVALGLLASLTGISLSLIAGWSISTFVFESTLVIPWIELLMLSLGVVVLTVIIGQLNSRGVYNKEALEVLRKEV